MAFRTASGLLVAVCLGAPAAAVSAQLPGPIPHEKEPPVRAPMQERRIPVTVSGCLRGNRLEVSAASFNSGLADLFNTDQFILEGSKDLMRQIRKDHAGHYDEITGVAILRPVPDGSSTTDVETKPLGKKGSITLGVREGNGVTQDVRQPVRLKVEGLRHRHDGCAGL
jgi:hypothetical protein